MADKRTSFYVDLKGNASSVAKETSSAVDALAESIAKGEAAAKDMSSELRKLRGSSAEVKAQKDKLKAAIGATNQAVTRDTIALHKLGTTSAEVARQQKQLADAQKHSAERMKKSSEDHRKQSDALKKAIGSIGGPANDVMSKLGGLSEVAEGLGTAGGVAALGVAAAAAAVVAVGGAAL
jgi:methyl-accepting chemotaxis protein